MVESGCLGNVIGFESLDIENLRQMRKAPNLVAFDRYAGAVATLRAHHLQTWAAFALGYDNDTVESILATCEWGIENHFTFAAFNVLMPYPSTPFYERLKAEGRLLYDGRWWLHPDFRFNYAAFRPTRMTADELTEAAWACRRRFNSRASIFERALDRADEHGHALPLRHLLRLQPALPPRDLQAAGHAAGGPMSERIRHRHSLGRARRRARHPRPGRLGAHARRRGRALRPRARLLPGRHHHGRPLRRAGGPPAGRRAAGRHRLPRRAPGLCERAGDAAGLHRADPGGAGLSRALAGPPGGAAHARGRAAGPALLWRHRRREPPRPQGPGRRAGARGACT